jgi:hypothetical protein
LIFLKNLQSLLIVYTLESIVTTCENTEMEESGIVLQPLNLNKENNDSSPSTARSTSVKRSGSGEPNSPSIKVTDLSINLSISDASTTIPSNDSVLTIDRPNNVVTNFLSEIEPRNNEPFNVSWDNIFKNIYYILAWYFFSTALSFYNKNLMGKENFNLNLPLLISAMHTGMHFLVTMILMNGHCSFIYKRPEGKSVSVHSYFTRVVSYVLKEVFMGYCFTTFQM